MPVAEWRKRKRKSGEPRRAVEVKLPYWLIAILDTQAEREHTTRSDIIERILKLAFTLAARGS